MTAQYSTTLTVPRYSCVGYICTAVQFYRIQPYRGTGVKDTVVSRYSCILYTCTAVQLYPIHLYRGTVYRISCIAVQIYRIQLYRGTGVYDTAVPRYRCIGYSCTVVQLYPVHLYRRTAVSDTPVPRYGCILYICNAVQVYRMQSSERRQSVPPQHPDSPIKSRSVVTHTTSV